MVAGGTDLLDAAISSITANPEGRTQEIVDNDLIELAWLLLDKKPPKLQEAYKIVASVQHPAKRIFVLANIARAATGRKPLD